MDEIKKSAELLRHELSSINMDDIYQLIEEKITDEEVENVAADAEIFYRITFEKRIKLLLYAQLEFLGKEAVNDAQLQFARGTFNGLFLVHEWFKDQIKRSTERFTPPQTKKEGEPIKTVGNINT